VPVTSPPTSLLTLLAHLRRPIPILTVFLALAIVYNVALPVFEAADEAWHYVYAHYLASERRLPDLKHDLPSHEAAQPPLYYAVVALIISPFDHSNLEELTRLNPDWLDRALNPDQRRVRGQHLRTEADRWPYQGAVWAVRAARLLSSLLGALTIALVYATARLIFSPAWPIAPTLCAALVAFNPKFIHISSIVNNDIAITLAATAACWWMVRLAKQPSPRGFALLGALVGVATLCKLQGLGLFAPALAALALIRPPAAWPLRLAALLAGFGLVAGGWLLFNTLNYGHPLAWEQVQAANAALARVPPLTVGEVVATLPLWFTSYWGNLGIELHYDEWVNAVLFAALGVAVAGCALAFARRLPQVANRTGLALLLIWQAALAAMFAWWLRGYSSTENSRLIMPGVGVTAMLVTLGWLTLAPAPIQRVAAIGGAAALLMLAVAAPFVTIRPAYAEPQTYGRDAIVAVYRLPSAGVAVFDGAIDLLHAEVQPKHVEAGKTLRVTLYWGARWPITQSYRVLIEAFDLAGTNIGSTYALPYNGRFATQRWQPGAYFRDEYALRIAPDAPHGPARIQLSLARLYPSEGRAQIDGAPWPVFLIDRVKVRATVPASSITSGRSPLATFGDLIRLDEARVEPDHVTFFWTALRAPEADYTVFIHVLDGDGQMIGQHDGQPFGGEYPTSLWDAGERVRDARALELPPAMRRLRVGWYDHRTGQRLPAYMPDGRPWPDDAVSINIHRP
jgi:4-amino-4-deoxy-L-arabinose transferase-like glycosyltransferase